MLQNVSQQESDLKKIDPSYMLTMPTAPVISQRICLSLSILA